MCSVGMVARIRNLLLGTDAGRLDSEISDQHVGACHENSQQIERIKYANCAFSVMQEDKLDEWRIAHASVGCW